MSDLGDEIRRRVQGARENAQHRQEDQNRAKQEEANLDQRRKQRATELKPEIERRLREAAESSDGSMRFTGPMMEPGGEASYAITWEDPHPQRILKVVVGHVRGVIEWTWMLRGEVGRTALDPLDFDMGLLDRLILALADQESWADGHPPSV